MKPQNTTNHNNKKNKTKYETQLDKSKLKRRRH